MKPMPEAVPTLPLLKGVKSISVMEVKSLSRSPSSYQARNSSM